MMPTKYQRLKLEVEELRDEINSLKYTTKKLDDNMAAYISHRLNIWTRQQEGNIEKLLIDKENLEREHNLLAKEVWEQFSLLETYLGIELVDTTKEYREKR